MNKTQRLQQEVTAYIAETYNTKPYEWLTGNRFVDHHGCDGYVFKNERAAGSFLCPRVFFKISYLCVK